VRFIEAAEAIEGGEELVVATDAGAGDETAHGEGVDESVIEVLLLEGLVGTNIAFATDRLRRQAARGAIIFCEAEGGGVDAEQIGRSVFDEGFGIDGAGEMHVQVSAFGHAGEKGVELKRAAACDVEGTDGALLVRSDGGAMNDVPACAWR